MMRRKHWIAAVAALVILGGGVAAWRLAPRAPVVPEPEKQTPDEVVAYIASDKFARLPEPERYAYFRKIDKDSPWRIFRRAGEADVDEETMKKLRENVRPLMHRHMKERMDEYFGKSPEEKQAHLDAMIDRMQERRKDWEARRKEREAAREANPDGAKSGSEGSGEQRSSGERRRRRGFSLDRLRQRIEESDPESRAQRMQFWMDLRKRMEERGVQFGRGRGRSRSR
jgi:hypothetical protein